MGLVMRLAVIASFFLCINVFAQFGDWGNWGNFGGNNGFGGNQSGSNKVETSEEFIDVNYASDGKKYHDLDIYLPKEEKSSYPVVIHTYGSAWSMNDSKGSDLKTIGDALLKAGYAFVTPNHRSASDAIYPAQLHDLKAVVRFLRGNASKYKIDTSFIAMSGFSSGGHLSSLVATTCGKKEGVSGNVKVDLEGSLGEFTSFSSCIDAASLWSPPTDIFTMNPINNFMGSGTYEGAFIGAEREGNKDKWMVASSPYYVDESTPPIILFHGTSDNIVNIEQSQEMYDSLKAHNVVSSFEKVQGGTHGGNEMYVSENLNKMVDFFNSAKEAKLKNAVQEPIVEPNIDPIVEPNKDASDVEIPQFVFKNELNVNKQIVEYKVFSVDGTLSRVSKTLDLSRLKPGVYCIFAKTSRGKFYINRVVIK